MLAETKEKHPLCLAEQQTFIWQASHSLVPQTQKILNKITHRNLTLYVRIEKIAKFFVHHHW